jgi:hypothetical protein
MFGPAGTADFLKDNFFEVMLRAIGSLARAAGADIAPQSAGALLFWSLMWLLP